MYEPPDSLLYVILNLTALKDIWEFGLHYHPFFLLSVLLLK